MNFFRDSTAARILANLTHQPRHRQPRITVDETRIEDDYVAGFIRHAFDELPCLATPPAPRSVDESLSLAGMDAESALTAAQVQS